ncbi:hypothetical protein BCR42DRAFT_158470 [Absidia repens]|uniref:Uncharacterized protein n=1 Tax=Absidia repens TaxID=90262 RepID=A0A1X2I1W5_9FUNG|nr:hypothetical protein BCR42DRAFT_158470 [Absidia repens]
MIAIYQAHLQLSKTIIIYHPSSRLPPDYPEIKRPSSQITVAAFNDLTSPTSPTYLSLQRNIRRSDNTQHTPPQKPWPVR